MKNTSSSLEFSLLTPSDVESLGEAVRSLSGSVSSRVFSNRVDINLADSDACYQLASGLMERGEYEFSERLIKHAIALNPDQGHLFNKLSHSYARRKLQDEAELFARMALEREPFNVGYLCHLCFVLAGNKKVVEAEDLLRARRVKAPGDGRVLHALSIVLAQSGKLREALDVASASVHADGSKVEPMLHLANLQMRERGFSEVEGLAHRVLALEPRNLSALRLLSSALEMIGRRSEALVIAEQAVAEHPGAIDMKDTVSRLRTLQSHVAKPEKVRLVVWDLDETFWRGTLSEGGITSFSKENCDIVVELARRGIVSTICSKNDLEPVRDVLASNQIWDYFVLPSVSWEPKGPRIQRLIDLIGLRAPTVLFIDDNPLNLEEARRFVTGIQTAGVEIIPKLLSDPLLKGKDDRELTRLKQYKILEQRRNEQEAAGSDVSQFLRESCITVEFEYDVEQHLDRFIELINRTNQLNFTKGRLPEEPELARVEARKLLSRYNLQASLVHVKDRYGDHGFCGVYVHNSEARRLEHFAFSCRILGMGVERWLYQRLGRPQITISGDVLADLHDPEVVDWIKVGRGADIHADSVREAPWERVVARGGCDLGALIHYFRVDEEDVVGEYHVFRNGGTFRTDHSNFLRYAVAGLGEDQLAAAKSLGYVEGDFQSRIFDATNKKQVVVLSFPADCLYALYRHRKSGLEVPFSILVHGKMSTDLRGLTEDQYPVSSEWTAAAFHALRHDFEFVGLINQESFSVNLRLTLSALPSSAKIVVLEFVETFVGADGNRTKPFERAVQMNRWIKDVCSQFDNVCTISVTNLIQTNTDAADSFHFDRKLYFKMFERIKRAVM